MPEKNLLAYQSAMAQASAMLRRGIIDERDYAEAEGIFARKYGINSGSLYREIDLINQEFRANMSHDERGDADARNDQDDSCKACPGTS